MTTPVQTVAKFIVQHSREPVSNLKLQKLLYYVQGWSLGIYKKPIFEEEIQAWVHGPVVPDVFNQYRQFRWTPIEIPRQTLAIDDHTKNHIKSVLDVYGKWTASQLEALSHKESPWLVARGSLSPDTPSRAVITHASMKEFFSGQVHG